MHFMITHVHEFFQIFWGGGMPRTANYYFRVFAAIEWPPPEKI